jgi:ABC-type glycerol-3-phosphate transport system substrate-binding protein
MKNTFFKRTIQLVLISLLLMTTGLSCKCMSQTPSGPETKPIQLNYWGVWDDTDDLQQVIGDFQAEHPNIKITYKKFRFAEYEQKLLEGWASGEGQGADIYSLPATWLLKYQNKITPMPASVKLAYQQVKTTLGKTEIQTVVKQTPTLTLNDLKKNFVNIVAEDVVINNQIYGLPLSLDSLVLYYNRGILDASEVPVAPSNWTDLATAVKKITKLDKDNKIIQSAIALGTADNINQVLDITSLLMMQNGAKMMTGNSVSFGQASSDSNTIPGLQALQFYTDFANPIKETYTWNNQMPNSFEAFVSGQTAMFFGYSYYLPLIRAQAPKIDLGIAAMPQIHPNQPINYTDYWVETVSHQVKTNQQKLEAAWGFLNYISSNSEVEKYLNQAKKPSALRDLIEKQKLDPDIGVFANQTLSATHWYKGRDILKTDDYFREMINNLSSNTDGKNQILIIQQTANLINQTL